MNTRLSNGFLTIGWLLLGAPSIIVAQDNELTALCSQYQTTDPPTAPADDDIPDLRHDRGLLWQLEAPGGKISHLFGTLHSQDHKVSSLPPQARLALARSKQLLIEVVPDEEANRIFADAMFAHDGSDLARELPEPLFEEFSRIAVDYHIPAEEAGRLTPWAAFSVIGRPRPVNAPTQDMMIHQEAEQRSIPVTGLESMRELLDTLSSLAREDQIEILTDTICNHDRIIAGNRILVDLYIQRDLAAMVAFNEGKRHDESVFQRFMEATLYKRNERLLERMQPYLDQGGVFIAVGALHLPGERGLLNLLEQNGYTVESVY